MAARREAIYAIRRTVFVLEQNVPEEFEIDEIDPVRVHGSNEREVPFRPDARQPCVHQGE